MSVILGPLLSTFGILGGSINLSGNASFVEGGHIGYIPPLLNPGSITVAPPYTTITDNTILIEAQQELQTAFTITNNAISDFSLPSNLAGYTTILAVDIPNPTLPGVYVYQLSIFGTSINSGNFTIDMAGVDNDVTIIFKMGGQLLIFDGNINVINGSSCNIYWSNPGFTNMLILGSNSLNPITFIGNILTNTSVTIQNTNVTPGRILGTSNLILSSINNNNTLCSPTIITNFSPTSGPTSGGTLVTINGNGFTGLTNVLFGGEPATIIFNDNNVINVITPAHTSGFYSIVVIVNDIITESDSLFTFIPIIINFSPTSGPAYRNILVTINGNGFTGLSNVLFGNVAATIISNNDTTITVLTPRHSPGSYRITIIIDGTIIISYTSFTFIPNSINPDNGLQNRIVQNCAYY